MAGEFNNRNFLDLDRSSGRPAGLLRGKADGAAPLEQSMVSPRTYYGEELTARFLWWLGLGGLRWEVRGRRRWEERPELN